MTIRDPSLVENFIGFASGLIANFASPLSPLGRQVIQTSNWLARNNLPEPVDLIKLYLHKDITEAAFYDLMGSHGYNSERTRDLVRAARSYLTIAEYMTLYRRDPEKMPWFDVVDAAEAQGFTEEDVQRFFKISEYFPSPGDLIRFAVREVYTTDTRDKFGMDEDLPQLFIDEAKKAGLPEEQARNYWAAHWELPSPLQGFEMLHRRVISESELDLLLRSLDVMPFWRDKLKQISYNPLTRVDVRRMYALGVLNETDVYNSYLDVGYSPKNARLMTEFTIKYENDEVTGITRANVINSFKDGLITLEQLTAYLQAFGYNEDIVKFWVDTAEYEKAVEDVQKYSNDIIEQFQKGMLSLDNVRKELLLRDMPTSFVDKVIDDIVVQKAKRTKVPTRSDLESWLKRNIINEEYYTQQMRLLGYRDEDIQYYLSDITIDIDTSDVKWLQWDIYMRWFKKGILTQDDILRIGTAQGRSEDDIMFSIQEIQEQ